MLYTLGIIILMIFVFTAIIRYFGDLSNKNDNLDDYNDSVKYVPKKFHLLI